MDQKNKKDISFHEVQKFRQRLLWLMLLLLDALSLIIFGYGMFKQLILGIAWGNRPMSDSALVIVGLLTILLLAVLTYIFYTTKLITEVRSDGISIRFYPLTHKLILYDNIKRCETRKYNPVREYGGWGIRYGRKGKAYNISGNLGVQLELTNGKFLLIGSQKPEELVQAIQTNINKYRGQG